MTESEARDKPLHEVWAQFQLLAKSGNPYTRFNPEWRLQWEASFNNLRSILLDRCRSIKGVFISRIDYNPTPGEESMITIEQLGNFFHADPETLRNLSAMSGFWAWELEQRLAENPANAGNNPSETA